MGCAHGAGVDDRLRFGDRAVRVSHGDPYAARGRMGRQLCRSGQFRRDCHQPHLTFGGITEAVEGWYIGREEMSSRLHTALGVGQEWPFEVNPNGPRPAGNHRPLDDLRQSRERLQRYIERRGHRGCEEYSSTTRGEEFADVLECVGRRLHDVVSSGAVKMHVEECRSQGRAGKVEDLRVLSPIHKTPHRNRIDMPVFYCDGRVLDEMTAVPESLRSDDRAHALDYCRQSARLEVANSREQYERA